MNNFHINFVVLSFTDLQSILFAVQNNGEIKRMQKFEKQIEYKKKEWRNQTVGIFEKQVERYDSFIKTELGLNTNA